MADHEALVSAIEEHALQAGAPSSPGSLLWRLIEAARQQVGLVPKDAWQTLKSATLAAYDRIMAAYDIPGIGEPFESMLEAAIRDGLSAALDKLLPTA